MPAGSVISTIVISPPVSAAVALISASPPNHQIASPSPAATAVAFSVGVESLVMFAPVQSLSSKSSSEIA